MAHFLEPLQQQLQLQLQLLHQAQPIKHRVHQHSARVASTASATSSRSSAMSAIHYAAVA
jgi:hypothetical protein